MKKRILTGDRPTGKLHLGHYVGSLQNRIKLQDEYDQFVLVADLQGLTDNFEHPEKIRDNILEVALDYLAVGIDPEKSTILIQSQIPEIAELAILLMNLVTVPRLIRNPTVKSEIKNKGFGEQIPVGFLVYPIHQVADITIFRASLVPVGADQAPMLEQSREVVRDFNRIYGNVLVEPEALIPKNASRLVGIDGKNKMSKSLGNAINLSDDEKTLKEKVMQMYTDPGHIKVEDPGKIEGNTVFTYLDLFDPDKAAVDELKTQYKKGGLGDVKVKMRLFEILNEFLKPIRERRAEFAKDPAQVMKILKTGTEKAREAAAETMVLVRKAMKLDHF
ncbi:tryptophan--tRNA ligase [bacterium]|nr:tryptophan--tRNA ligase [bacterium]